MIKAGLEPRLALTAVAVCLALASIGLGELVANVAEFAIRGLLVVVAGLVALLFVRQWHKDRLKRKPPQFDVHEVPLANVFGLKRRAGDLVSLDALGAKLFALSVTNPSDIRQRVAETYAPERRTLQRTVSIECQLPTHYVRQLRQRSAEDADVLYFPLVLPLKGTLHDKFTVTDANGSHVSTLTYREYLQLTACTLRLFLLTAYGYTRYSELPQLVKDAEKSALSELITRRDARQAYPTPAMPPRLEELNALETHASAGTVENNTALALARNLMRKLVDNYAVVAVVHPDRNGRFVVRYEEAIVPDLALTGDRGGLLERLVGWLRVALGSRPIDVTVGIGNASTCQSYHLRFLGTEGMYLRDQTPLDYEQTVSRRAAGAPTLPHLRFKKRLGQPFAHFYTRYFPEFTSGEFPRIRFQFAEVPPGSLVRAAVTAVSSLALIWIIALLSSSLADTQTDAPAFLLAFPAIAATWLGFDSPQQRLFEGTLRARFSLMLTVIQSLAAAALHIVYGSLSDANIEWLAWPAGTSILGVTDVGWSIVLSVSLVNAIYIVYKYWLHTFEFSYYSTRFSGEGAVQGG